MILFRADEPSLSFTAVEFIFRDTEETWDYRIEINMSKNPKDYEC